jgi:C4-dicarboxylate-specific signal transduction histidine kinase
MELVPATTETGTAIDLRSALEELRVLTGAAMEEAGIQTRWAIATDLPLVWADRYGVIQVFLNLVRNSQRALERADVRQISVTVAREGDHVIVRVEDTGPGVESPENLFRPFQRGAGATGLGLYVSRTILRSFGGDLVHAPRAGGACFEVRLRAAAEAASPAMESTHEVRA